MWKKGKLTCAVCERKRCHPTDRRNFVHLEETWKHKQTKKWKTKGNYSLLKIILNQGGKKNELYLFLTGRYQGAFLIWCLKASGSMILMTTLESQEIFTYEAVFARPLDHKDFENILKMYSLQQITLSADVSFTQTASILASEIPRRWVLQDRTLKKKGGKIQQVNAKRAAAKEASDNAPSFIK